LVAEEKKEGYVGIDIKKTDAVDYVVSATGLKYEDNKIENIYTRRCFSTLSARVHGKIQATRIEIGTDVHLRDTATVARYNLHRH
jgi:hypothetical protein